MKLAWGKTAAYKGKIIMLYTYVYYMALLIKATVLLIDYITKNYTV